MLNFDTPFGLFLMLDLVLFPVGVLLLLLILRKAGRVERALWAVVSQLQAIRRELPASVAPVALPGIEPAVPGKRHVVLSMFGR
jgi:hypothetical protein